jgi:hypothetical protein
MALEVRRKLAKKAHTENKKSRVKNLKKSLRKS